MYTVYILNSWMSESRLDNHNAFSLSENSPWWDAMIVLFSCQFRTYFESPIHIQVEQTRLPASRPTLSLLMYSQIWQKLHLTRFCPVVWCIILWATFTWIMDVIVCWFILISLAFLSPLLNSDTIHSDGFFCTICSLMASVIFNAERLSANWKKTVDITWIIWDIGNIVMFTSDLDSLDQYLPRFHGGILEMVHFWYEVVRSAKWCRVLRYPYKARLGHECSTALNWELELFSRVHTLSYAPVTTDEKLLCRTHADWLIRRKDLAHEFLFWGCWSIQFDIIWTTSRVPILSRCLFKPASSNALLFFTSATWEKRKGKMGAHAMKRV